MKQTSRAVAAFAILAVCSTAFARAATSSDQVAIESGKLRGSVTAGVLSFKGIPFAAPPVGALRWHAPQAVMPWDDVRQATAYGHDCMQKPFPSDAAPLGTKPAEDCLYLNVWRPAKTTRKLPVMVWIYGGGFTNGGASPPTYAGDELAKSGILVVSFNYRVGRFGTFAHPLLTRANADHGLLSNYGYMDQIAALHWVRRNIAAFGGDPDNVTIVGESAGGISVHMLLTSPLAQGLFEKAVIQSGGPGGLPPETQSGAEGEGLAFAASQGIGRDDPAALEKLRAFPAEAVVDGLNMAALFMLPKGPKTFSSPVFDGRLSVDPVAAYRSGVFRHVPVMVGATSDDLGGPDGVMIKGAALSAALLSARHVPVWYYRFSYVANSVQTPATKGAAHATDIPFFFNTAAIKYGEKTSVRDRQAAKLASAYLVNFVKSGNPNGTSLPQWVPYGVQRGLLNLTTDGTAVMQAASPAP